ncbi:ATP-binding protein [Paraflavitalea sp. CAU 1676]|uniref:ATP-binding protein n=1 Tax=Paraflavitalea sp. CAU 1676 TaxID=3032598 RepID=UPI0023DA6C9B|nr:ATP-binding protein [Paraflavitalea sp. CAU 1676]MDF2190284.1 ATP-binding protein [Paraflavitalea sp. CAU 1676]
MKFRFQYIYGLFILSFGILTVLALMFYKRLSDSTLVSNEVERNYQTMVLLGQVDAYLKEAINAEHAFMLVRDSSLLEPVWTSAARIKPIIDSLKPLVNGQSTQAVNLTRLEGLVTTRLSMAKDNIAKAARNTDSGNLSQRLLQTRVNMADYQQLYERMQAIETAAKRASDSQKLISQRNAPNYLYATFIFSAICLTISFMFIIRELTKRLEFQQQLQQQVGSLNRANAELEQLTNIASHHLQEPLRKIQTFSNQVTTRFKDLPEEVNLLLGKMDASARHMHGLTRDMVRYSSLINTSETLLQIDLNYVLMKVAEQMDEKLTIRQARLVITNTLPVIKGIPSQLAILFEQLIDNSIKFARKDVSPVITITHEGLTGNKISEKIVSVLLGGTAYHKITISDNGMGFDNKYVDKMFYLFQKLESPQGIYQSKGIGLPMVQRIMINHGGNVTASGIAGEGAVFTLYFPLQR